LPVPFFNHELPRQFPNSLWVTKSTFAPYHRPSLNPDRAPEVSAVPLLLGAERPASPARLPAVSQIDAGDRCPHSLLPAAQTSHPGFAARGDGAFDPLAGEFAAAFAVVAAEDAIAPAMEAAAGGIAAVVVPGAAESVAAEDAVAPATVAAAGGIAAVVVPGAAESVAAEDAIAPATVAVALVEIVVVVAAANAVELGAAAAAVAAVAFAAVFAVLVRWPADTI
jgi:hypothetical protein